MKHLCIINPMAGQTKGQVDKLVNEINAFFTANPSMNYQIHVTRWKRDASGFAMRYASNASEIVRVYAFGGGGTLFEIINGVIGLPNVQVAYYPLGEENGILCAFGDHPYDAFKSLGNLSLSPVITIDTILAGNHHFISNAMIGFEAASYQLGKKLSEQFKLPLNCAYFVAGLYHIFIKKESRYYNVEVDGVEMNGDYIGFFVGNISCHGYGTNAPAPEAKFDDGYLDLYTLKQVPFKKIFWAIKDYQAGCYDKWPEYFNHYRCKKVKISSPAIMTISTDGELFYAVELNFKIHPYSLNFVCPWGCYKKSHA